MPYQNKVSTFSQAIVGNEGVHRGDLFNKLSGKLEHLLLRNAGIELLKAGRSMLDISMDSPDFDDPPFALGIEVLTDPFLSVFLFRG